MGYAGDEHDEESLGESPEEGHVPPRRAVPDPLDRLWMHPSELSPFVGASSATPVRHRPMWTATLVAGAAGAILTLGVLSAVGAIGRSSESTGEHQAVPTSAPITSAPIVSATARAIGVGRRSVVTVSVHDESGTRRGSGVCVRRSHGVATTTKEILTSNRLVGLSTHVKVTTSDGVVHSARIVGRDAISDLVLLRLDSGIPAAASAERAPRTGDTVWVVGARPGATSPWMSTGEIASTDSIVSLATGPTTSGLLETGAASSAASSGGALVDADGKVTGIVLSPVSDSRTTYAVPIETALSIAADLRSLGYARHGALGINGIDASAGPTVTAVVAGGPAHLAGIRVGDVVETVDKHPVDSIEDVMALVRHDMPGQPVMVELRRGSRKVAVQATLVNMDTP